MVDLDEKPEKYQETELDWDFDFSGFKTEEDDEALVDLKTMVSPRITRYKSKFSNGQKVLDKLAELEMEVSKHAIKVGTRTQDINDLWRLFSVVEEYWDNIRHTYGTLINDDIINIKKRCIELMEESSDGVIHHKVHNNLLYFKSTVYKLAQLGNFRFEVEKSRSGIYNKAQKKILQ